MPLDASDYLAGGVALAGVIVSGALTLVLILRQDNLVKLANEEAESRRAFEQRDTPILSFGAPRGEQALKQDISGLNFRFDLVNEGLRDAAISVASFRWVEDGHTLNEDIPVEATEEWSGKGPHTVPAGTRRGYRVLVPAQFGEPTAWTTTQLQIVIMPVGGRDIVASVTPLGTISHEQGNANGQEGI